jgi:hypothetical protein
MAQQRRWLELLGEPGFYHKDRLTGVAGRLRNVGVFLLAETEMKTEISEDDFANAKRVNEGEIWRPRRDLNPFPNLPTTFINF